MNFGYTLFDPVIVIVASALFMIGALTKPARLIYYFPALLSVYLFVPFVTLLRLSDIIVMILVVFFIFRWRVVIPREAKPLLIIFLVIFFCQFIYATIFGAENYTRTMIRTLHYVGLLAIFLFSFKYCQKEENYCLLIRGAALIAVIHALYSIYQLIAIETGLPFRGIVRGTDEVQIAFESEFFRVNGLADEPKRLGYVLAIGTFALYELARRCADQIKSRVLRTYGIVVFGVSTLTFSGSYFAAIFATMFVVLTIYPKKLIKIGVPAFFVMILCLFLFNDLFSQYFEALSFGLDRRLDEIEIGTDGKIVYRQEFYVLNLLQNSPVLGFLGVGLGQSNAVLNSEFGQGAGYYDDQLLPLNSVFFQLILDFGLPIVFIIYFSLFAMIVRAWRRKNIFLLQVLLLLTIQSFYVITTQFIALFIGAALARMPKRSQII